MKEIRLDEHKRLRMLTREMGDLLAAEVMAVCDLYPSPRREEVVRALVKALTRSAAQILLADVLAAVRRRSAENSAIMRILAGI